MTTILSRKKLHVQLFTLILMISLVLTGLTVQQINVHATGTTYYVSTSGNDNNNGTSSSTPWQSLTKVSSVTFQPGDQILFKCGDTWTGQTLSLHSNNASSANWVTVNSYGSGNRPIISPGNNAQYAVLVSNTQSTDRNSGWKIVNLEVSNARMGIAYMDMRSGSTYENGPSLESYILDGFWVENCYIHNISGNGYDNFPSYPDEYSAGIRVLSNSSFIKNVTLKDNIINNCDLGVSSRRIQYFTYDNLSINYPNIHGMMFWGVKDGAIQNNHVLHAGVVGKSSGTAALEFDHTCHRIVVNNNELAYTKSVNQPDGCGIDFEGFDYEIYITNNYIHDNDGRAFNLMPYPLQHLKMLNNLCKNNGSDSDYVNEPALMLMGGNGTYTDIEVGGNVIVRDHNGQTIFNQEGTSTDNVPSSINYHDNTVYPAGSNPSAPSTVAVPAFPSGSSNLYTWTFDNGSQGWWSNDVANFSASGGKISGNYAGGDPYVISADNLGINICDNPYIKIRLKNNTSATTASIYFITTSESDWGWLDSKQRTFSITPNDSGYTDYVVNMTYTRGYAGTLKQLRINPLSTNGSFEIDSITLYDGTDGGTTTAPTATATATPTNTGGGAAYSWDFNDGVQGWYSGHSVNLSANNGSLISDITGNDPYIFSSNNLGVDISTNKIIHIRMKNTSSGAYSKFYYTTNADQNWDENKTMLFSISSNDSGYTDYTVDMSNLSSFSGTLKQLRLNPAFSDSGTVYVDYITVGSTNVSPPPTVTVSITPTATSSNHTWEFNTDGNTQGWWAAHDVSNLSCSGGVLNGTETGTDPYIVSSDNLGLNISTDKTITLRYRNNSPSTSATFYFITNSDGNYGEDKKVNFTVTANDTGYTTYTVDMSSCSNYTGTLRQLRLDPENANTGDFSIDYINIGSSATPTDTPVPTITATPAAGYAAEFTSGIENWWNCNDISNFTASGGYLNGTITGGDPNMWSPDNLGVSSANKYLRIRMKNSTSGTDAQIFFSTNSDGSFSESKSKHFTMTANDANYTEYVVDMSTVSGWTGTIRRFRIDPPGSSGTFSVDYIRLTSN